MQEINNWSFYRGEMFTIFERDKKGRRTDKFIGYIHGGKEKFRRVKKTGENQYFIDNKEITAKEYSKLKELIRKGNCEERHMIYGKTKRIQNINWNFFAKTAALAATTILLSVVIKNSINTEMKTISVSHDFYSPNGEIIIIIEEDKKDIDIELVEDQNIVEYDLQAEKFEPIEGETEKYIPQVDATKTFEMNLNTELSNRFKISDGAVKSFMYYDSITCDRSRQWHLINNMDLQQISEDCPFVYIDGHVAIALGSAFGPTGSIFAFVDDTDDFVRYPDGRIITFIKADEKADQDTIGGFVHNTDTSVVEFILNPNSREIKEIRRIHPTRETRIPAINRIGRTLFPGAIKEVYNIPDYGIFEVLEEKLAERSRRN